MAKERHWRCVECGYLHIGPEPPDICPECLAPKGAFVEVEPSEKVSSGKE